MTCTSTMSPTLTASKRMLDVAVTDLGNMHQSVLMHADIHKRPEIDHVAHGSF